MKWKRKPTEFLPEKTFLIVKDDLRAFGAQTSSRTKKSSASTGTWPPKMKRVQPFFDEIERPKTANLERPSVLDPVLVDKLDMSLLSKELLCDSITRFRHSKASLSGGTSSKRCEGIASGQQSSTWPSSAWFHGVALRQKRRSLENLPDRSICRVDLGPESPDTRKQARMNGLQENHSQSKKLDNRQLDDNNNRDGANGVGRLSSLSAVKKKSSRTKLPSDLQLFVSAGAKNAPEPCKTCGRPDQPERFHSHARSNLARAKDNALGPVMPKSVQKPVALNFRSDKSRQKTAEEESKGKNVHLPSLETQKSSTLNPRPSSAPLKKGPKTITCYICGREFGTASFPIHEVKCMQRWERENNALPPSQRRSTPRRPNVGDPQQWNQAAWQESQAQLLPCPRCERTFLADRLAVHQKSCKAIPKVAKGAKGAKGEKRESAEKKLTSAKRDGPPTVKCQICGRNFGTRSIKIHQAQCVKRWHVQANKAADGAQGQGQGKRESSSAPKSPVVSNVKESSSGDTPPKQTVACYACNKNFAPDFMAIHESRCPGKLRQENDSLSPGRPTPEPRKNDNAIYDHESGTIASDEDLTEILWKSHLQQLVPCKRCKRTFNPDRIDIHERSCKGTR